jgi:hypothetical protein
LPTLVDDAEHAVARGVRPVNGLATVLANLEKNLAFWRHLKEVITPEDKSRLFFPSDLPRSFLPPDIPDAHRLEAKG